MAVQQWAFLRFVINVPGEAGCFANLIWTASECSRANRCPVILGPHSIVGFCFCPSPSPLCFGHQGSGTQQHSLGSCHVEDSPEDGAACDALPKVWALVERAQEANLTARRCLEDHADL
mmetsp:Transcript_10419/g.31357  ORF Transcript_10419/g.31357 Transcript_10419/m.31357 type:complete len:119 (+) Transcript_10419:315-671(+)